MPARLPLPAARSSALRIGNTGEVKIPPSKAKQLLDRPLIPLARSSLVSLQPHGSPRRRVWIVIRRGKRVVVCYMDAPVPYAIEENFRGCFFEDDVDLALILQDQEIVYQLIQGNDGSGSSRTHLDCSSSCSHQRIPDERKLLEVANFESQLAVDEALARELHAIEEQIANASVGDNSITKERSPITSSTPNNGSTSANRSPQVVMEDGIDPDNMTYEELRQLGEAIGTESKGLPDDVIALLPTYKIGIFSRKGKNDECVICCMAYKIRDRLTKLPCLHQYHQTCVTEWLKINKACPVCNKEVFAL